MQSVNLMPKGYAQNEHAKRRLVISTTVMVSALLAMVGLARLMDKWAAQRLEANALLERNLTDLKRARGELAGSAVRVQTLSERLSLIRTLNHNRRWATYVAAVAGATPDEVLLTRAKIAPAAAPAEASTDAKPGTAAGPAPSPSSATGTAPTAPERDESKPQRLVLFLDGYALSATDITRFIAMLEATGIFEHVRFKNSQMSAINGKSVSRFELECPIRYEPRKGAAPQAVKTAAGPTGAGAAGGAGAVALAPTPPVPETGAKR